MEWGENIWKIKIAAFLRLFYPGLLKSDMKKDCKGTGVNAWAQIIISLNEGI